MEKITNLEFETAKNIFYDKLYMKAAHLTERLDKIKDKKGDEYLETESIILSIIKVIKAVEYLYEYEEFQPLKGKENRIRTCSEICIDADNNKNNPDLLLDLIEEISFNKYNYSLINLQFMAEHINGYAKEIK